MASSTTLDSPDCYKVAWIAALSTERAAAEAVLDENHAAPTGFTRHEIDENAYTWGRIGEHNIVIASLPRGSYGTTPAATTASNLLASLPAIRVGLLVGIGGGIARPNEGSCHDIRLGDVVVSQPGGTTGGVCQYDLIKAKSGNSRERTGFIGRPPTVLLNALTAIQSDHERHDSKIPEFLQQMFEENPKMAKAAAGKPSYCHQGFENDRLFKPQYDHTSGSDCKGCDKAEEVLRDPRDTTDPEIHYGIIASGNTLVKDAPTRDRILAEVGEDCLCFEMEAAGLMDHFPCLVIRGICDYADSHKNDRWQRYASATAAAYAKELLAYVPTTGVQETKRASDVLRSVQQKVDGTHQIAHSIKSDLMADKIKNWLRPPDPSTNANHARKLRHEGTGTWLLEHSVFQSWNSGSVQHLWLHGLAGCGKTVISATVLDHLKKSNDYLVLKFFFNFSDPTKQTLDGMLRSLAFQLYQGNSSSAANLHTFFHSHQNGSNQPETKALSDTVSKMLAAQRKTYIVLDALDESNTRSDLLQWIEDVASAPGLGHMQLLFTSRPETEFEERIPPLIGVKNSLPLDKQAVNNDIRSWVIAQLSQSHDFRRKTLSPDTRKAIQEKVGDGADGMFRWAYCQIHTLAQCDHEQGIMDTLVSLPPSLDETYNRMIESIPQEKKADAMRLLQFLVYSRRPLRVAEAKEVIATRIEGTSQGFNTRRRLFNESDLKRYCPGLLVIIKEELHLAHFSVKEYLVGEEQFKKLTASISITRTCLTYLTDIKDLSAEEIHLEFPMARYAARNWTSYAISAQASEDINSAIARFLDEEETFKRWTHLHQPDRPWTDTPGPPEGSRLYYASAAGLIASVRTLIANEADINAQGGYYDNALQAAAANGHQEIARALIEKGADINTQGGEYGNALQAAAARGYQEIARALIEKGADINAQGGKYGNALQAAIAEGYQEIARALIEKGADINAQGGPHGNALQAAAAHGRQEIARALIEKGANINAQGGYYGNALQAAVAQGYQEIARALIEKGADINAQGGYYGNTLQAAAARGHQEITRALIQKGADINAQGGAYGNALQAAIAEGYQEITRSLIQKGADINAQGGFYGNALQAAAVRGHQEITRSLIQKGADINAQGGEYGNALQAAVARGRQEIARALIEKGANINAQGGKYGNALQAAAARGRQEIARALIEKGANINAQGGPYDNALQAAITQGHLEIATFLLENGATRGQKQKREWEESVSKKQKP